MSYQTDIWLANLNEDDLDIFEIEEAFLEFGKAQHMPFVAEAVFDAFSAINDQSGPFPMHRTYGESIRKLCVEIARLMPTSSYCIRGVGEEFDDMWLGKYANGEEVNFVTFEGELAKAVEPASQVKRASALDQAGLISGLRG